MRTILLTGGTGEIGAAIASVFKAQEYEVIAPDRMALNLSDQAHITEYLSTFEDKIDVFIHCAGFNRPKSFVDIQLQDFQETFNTNSQAFYQLTQGLVRRNNFKPDAYVLGISSIYGGIARPGRFSYVAAKHALNGMVKSLALELAPLNIKVNTLAPGFVATRMTYQNNSQEKIAEIVKKIPLKKLAQPEDIAKIAYYLCSPDNRYITGQNIVADGGYTAGGFEE